MKNSTVATVKNASRLAHLDGLRGIAAFFVAFAHFFCLFDFGFYNGLSKDSLIGIEPWFAKSPLNIPFQGNIMVQIFFVLSGYVLVKAFLENSSFLGAFSRRYFRLAIPIFVGCLAAWLLNIIGLNFAAQIIAFRNSPWLVHYTPVKPDIGEVFSQGFYRILFTEPGGWLLDGPLWTMSIEFSGSIILIIFCMCLKNRKIDPYLILFIFTLLTWGYYQFYFICGTWLFLFEKKGYLYECIPWKIFAPASMLAVLYASQPFAKASFVYNIFSFGERHFIEYGTPNIFCFVPCDRTAFFHGFGALLILFLVNGSPFWKRFLARFVFLGKLSFPLYLLHQPLLFATAGIFLYLYKVTNNWPISISIMALAYVCLTWFFSRIMYVYVEKKAVAFSKRIGLSMDKFCEVPAIVAE